MISSQEDSSRHVAVAADRDAAKPRLVRSLIRIMSLFMRPW